MGIFGRDRDRDKDRDRDRDRQTGTPGPDERALAAGGSKPAGAQPASRGQARTGRSGTGTQRDDTAQRGTSVATIGKSIIFKGELTGNEDLQIDGRVEGNVALPGNELTVGASAEVTAEIQAKAVQVIGTVTGDIIATERVEVHSTGHVKGDIKAPRLLVQEGAVVNGSIQMTDVGKAAQAARPEAGAPNEARKTA